MKTAGRKPYPKMSWRNYYTCRNAAIRHWKKVASEGGTPKFHYPKWGVL